MKIIACTLVLLLGAAGTANSETYYTDLNGRTVNMYVPDGYCVLDASDPTDAMLLDFMTRASQNMVDILVAFVHCGQLEQWKQGARPTFDSFGYIATPTSGNLAEFPGTQDDLNVAIEQNYDQQVRPGMEAGMAQAQKTLNEMGTGVTIDEVKLLGYFGSDEYGSYIGLVQRLHSGQVQQKAVIGIYSAIAVQNRLIFLYLWDTYRGGEDEVQNLLEETQVYSRNQHEVNTDG
jgi:hypothetical protein